MYSQDNEHAQIPADIYARHSVCGVFTMNDDDDVRLFRIKKEEIRRKIPSGEFSPDPHAVAVEFGG